MEEIHQFLNIAFIAVTASLCGMLSVYLRQPPILGYILAGMVLGPSGFGLVENRETIALLAEMGVILLLYFLGMELSLRSFRHIWKIAIITALVQIALSLWMMQAFAYFFNWPNAHAILFGFCLALSSTVVAVKVLEANGQLRTHVGRITIGVLIAQDLAVAPMMVITGNLASGKFHYHVFLEVLLSIVILVAMIIFLTRRKKLQLPFAKNLDLGSDMAPLLSLTWCLAFAAGSNLIGLSPAFGAFLAGLIVGNSAQRQAIHNNAGPIQSVLLMVFFLSIGLLIDFGFFIDNFSTVLMLWAFVSLFKTLLNIGILRLLGQSVKNAFMVSVVLAQIGEFSFVLADVAKNTNAIDLSLHKMIVAVTVVSLVTTPIFTNAHQRLSHFSTNFQTVRGALRLIYFREWHFFRNFSQIMVDFSQRLFHRLKYSLLVWPKGFFRKKSSHGQNQTASHVTAENRASAADEADDTDKAEATQPPATSDTASHEEIATSTKPPNKKMGLF